MVQVALAAAGCGEHHRADELTDRAAGIAAGLRGYDDTYRTSCGPIAVELARVVVAAASVAPAEVRCRPLARTLIAEVARGAPGAGRRGATGDAGRPHPLTTIERLPTHPADLIRSHRRQRRSHWRRLNPGQQALLALAHLRDGDPFTRLAAG
ncbi:hypothetical protein F4558_001752 [Micromonospora profundi]|nr:hypothetical protein [Micromonospora profundi]